LSDFEVVSDGSGVEDWDYAFASNESTPGVLSVDVTECMSCADDVRDEETVGRDVDRPVDGVRPTSYHLVYRYCYEDSILWAIALAMASAEQMRERFGGAARIDETDSRSLRSCHESDIDLFFDAKHNHLIHRFL
jgi:hypothetical protein